MLLVRALRARCAVRAARVCMRIAVVCVTASGSNCAGVRMHGEAAGGGEWSGGS